VNRTKLLPLGAVLVTVLLWASAFVAIRHVGEQVSAGALALARLVVAGAALGAVVLVQHRRRGGPARQDRPVGPGAPAWRGASLGRGWPAWRGASLGRGWPVGRGWAQLAVCGVLWFGVYNVALNEAERRVDAGTAAMLVNVGPILIAVLAGSLLGEGFPPRLILGGAVAFAGIVVIGASTSPAAGADRWGVGLCLVAAVGYAVGVVAQKPLLTTVPALRVTWLACLVGAVCCLPFAPALVRDLGAAGPSTVAWTVYLGLMPTAVAFTTWAYALARTSAGRLGATTYLVPPVTVLLGWALLGETPPGLALAGGAVCLAGVYLSRRAPAAQPRAVASSIGADRKLAS
jgi:drug/metabolite transporter (DMT)-like permease